MKSLSITQQDEIHTLNCCLKSVNELLEPSADFNTVNREHLSVLLGYLLGRLDKAYQGESS